MGNSLFQKLVAEYFYKRIMSRVLKRNIYNIIQQSVDVIYNLEEDTISTANKALDSFILKTIDDLLCEEIHLTRNAAAYSENLLDNFL